MRKQLRISFLFTLFALLAFLVACGGTTDENDATEFTVSFDLNNSAATGKPNGQVVKKGEFATIPDDPELTDFHFDGWYKEKGTTNEFDFSDEAITANITLYAKWIDETEYNDIPDGLSYPEAYDRITDYIGQMTTLSSEAVNKYDAKNGSALILGFSSLYMKMGFQMIMFAFTATFGNPDLSEANIELAFNYFGLNADYSAQGTKYSLEFDQKDQETNEYVHVAYIVEYDPTTDSAKVKYYEGYKTNNQVEKMFLEFVRLSDGFAIQGNFGKYLCKIVNHQVITYTVSFKEEDNAGTSIYKNPGIANANWVKDSSVSSISFDGSKHVYNERELNDDEYRLNVYEFQADGTLIKKTMGEWAPIV
jgi:uncharacterized repeat protein (TIGR02543 family)